MHIYAFVYYSMSVCIFTIILSDIFIALVLSRYRNVLHVCLPITRLYETVKSIYFAVCQNRVCWF